MDRRRDLDRVYLGCLLSMVGLGLLQSPAWAQETVSAQEKSATMEILAIELEKSGAEAAPILFVEVANRSTSTLAGWVLEVRVDGELVDGYQDLLLLEPVAPGETKRLRLHRLVGGEAPLHLKVSVLEAWGAEAVSAPRDGAGEIGDDTWRLLEPLDGEWATAEQVFKAGEL